MPTHGEISNLINDAMFDHEFMSEAGPVLQAMGLGEATSEEQLEFLADVLFDYTHLAMVTATIYLVEHLFGNGSFDKIVDNFMDDELAKILAEG